MEYEFIFYKHKHLRLLNDKYKNIKSNIVYSLNRINENEEIEQNRNNKLNDFSFSDEIYDIINIIQYSSICISIFEKNKNNEIKNELKNKIQNESENVINDIDKKKNIIGVISLDYNILLHEKEEIKNIDLKDLYYHLSLYIKKYNIISNINFNNTLIINLIISDNTNYYRDFFSYLFYLIDELMFIIFFSNEYTGSNIFDIDNAIVIDINELQNVSFNFSFNKIIILNKYLFINKIYLRLTTKNDICDLHELFKKCTDTKEKNTEYIIYDIIEKKTDSDILITILNNKKKIIGFICLKKNIDINMLVNLYNLRVYNYLIKNDLFIDINLHLKSYKEGNKSLNKKKKIYLYAEFKQFILKKLKIENANDIEKKFDVTEKIIYDYLNERLVEDIEIYANYIIKKKMDTTIILLNIYNKLHYDYENTPKINDINDINILLLNKLIKLYSNISFEDIIKVSNKFYEHFDKIEKLSYNFNNDKTYKKIYQKIKKKKGNKSDDSSENNNNKINIIKINQKKQIKKAKNEVKEFINLSYYDIFLLLENIYPDIFKKNEIILLFLFFDLYEFIIIDETTIFDCVLFKKYLDQLVQIKNYYFICKYKYKDWLVKLNSNDKNAYALNLFILNQKYYNHCKEILLKIEEYYDDVDYIIATNNERGNIPFILNYFNRVHKKKKAHVNESLYILNKYTLFLYPITDYMKLDDIDEVKEMLENVNDNKKNKINEIIKKLKIYYKTKLQNNINNSEIIKQSFIELEFYEKENYYIFVTRCGNKIINISSGKIINNIDFYYKSKIFNFENIIIQNEAEYVKYFYLLFFSTIIIFKLYEKRIIYNILVLIKACSCHVIINDNLYREHYNHFKFLNKLDNGIGLYENEVIDGNENENEKDILKYEKKVKDKKKIKNKNEKLKDNEKNVEDENENEIENESNYLILTKHMCLRNYTNIDNNIIFWGFNDICIGIISKLLNKKKYFFNNIILICYKNINFEDSIDIKMRNVNLKSNKMLYKLKNMMMKERVKIIYDTIYNIDRKNKKIEISNNRFFFYDYLFICFDKEDITCYSFNINSYGYSKKKTYFMEMTDETYKHEKYDYLVKIKDYEKGEENENNEIKEIKENIFNKKKKDKKEKKLNISNDKNSFSSSDDISNRNESDLEKKNNENKNEIYSSDDYDNVLKKKNIKKKKDISSSSSLNSSDVNSNKSEKTNKSDISKSSNESNKIKEIDDTSFSSCFQTSEESNDDEIENDILNKEENIESEIKNEENIDYKKILKEKYEKIKNKKDENIKNDINNLKKNKYIKRNINGIFSITDPFIDKYFHKNSKYMHLVKNYVNYIIIYSNNIDILNIVYFFIKNNIRTYKLVIIYPTECNKCNKYNKLTNDKIKKYIFNNRKYYKDKDLNNFIFLCKNYEKSFYHKQYINENIKYALKKIFYIFNILKIRIIYGRIIGMKTNRNNHLKYILLKLCKHKKNQDISFITNKYICKNVILFPCRILISSYIFDINNHLLYVLQKSSIVYDEKICVNHNFQTNDKYIYSAGELCCYSNLYRISDKNILNHEYYSNYEIAKLVSKIFPKIIINECCLSYNIFNLGGNNINGTNKKYKKKKNLNNIELYKKIKKFVYPIIYFNYLPGNCYFYYFQVPHGDLYKYEDLSKFLYSKNNKINDLKNIYKVVLYTDTLEINLKNKNIVDYYNMKYYDIRKNIDIKGYYCKITTNAFNLINSFTYLGCDKLNFKNLHKLCNMSINYFYKILKNIKFTPQYDLLYLLNSDSMKSIFHYKFQTFKEKLKNNVINLPDVKNQINLLLKDVTDIDTFEEFDKKKEIKKDKYNSLINIIKKNVENNLIEYIKENKEQLNVYYLE